MGFSLTLLRVNLDLETKNGSQKGAVLRMELCNFISIKSPLLYYINTYIIKEWNSETFSIIMRIGAEKHYITVTNW